MRPTRMKSKHWLFTTCVVFYVANYMFLPSAAAGITSALNSDVFNTPTPFVVDTTLLIVDTTPTPILENTPQYMQTVILGDGDSTHNASVTMQSNTTGESIVLPADEDASLSTSSNTTHNITSDSTPVVIQDETSVDPDDADNASVLTSDNTTYNTTPDSTPVVIQDITSVDPDDADNASVLTSDHTTPDSTPVVIQSEHF